MDQNSLKCNGGDLIQIYHLKVPVQVSASVAVQVIYQPHKEVYGILLALENPLSSMNNVVKALWNKHAVNSAPGWGTILDPSLKLSAFIRIVDRVCSS